MSPLNCQSSLDYGPYITGLLPSSNDIDSEAKEHKL